MVRQQINHKIGSYLDEEWTDINERVVSKTLFSRRIKLEEKRRRRNGEATLSKYNLYEQVSKKWDLSKKSRTEIVNAIFLEAYELGVIDRSPDEILIQAKERWSDKLRRLGKEELDNIGERLEFCPRCSILAIRPKFVWGTESWLCFYCSRKLWHHNRKLWSRNNGLLGRCRTEHKLARFLSFLCHDLELIATGKQPVLWMRRKLVSDLEIRKAIVRASRRRGSETIDISPKIWPREGNLVGVLDFD